METDNYYKIYTRTGDMGRTALLHGRTVEKSDRRIEACGDLDELNAYLGLLITCDLPTDDRALLLDAQNRLFDFGVCVVADNFRICVFDGLKESVASLEQAIDVVQQEVGMPRAFILPGGCREAAFCHICRTVCRRAERHLCALHEPALHENGVLSFINRLSDYLYALSLKINFKSGSVENLWQKRCRFEK